MLPSPSRLAPTLAIAALVLGMLASPALAAPPPGDSAEWGVVALAAGEGTPMRDRVEGLREALRRELGPGLVVLEEDEILRRLGLGPHGLGFVEEQLEEAELFYFQFEFSSAARSLRRAIEALAARSEPRATQRSRAAHFLLGAVHFGIGGAGAEALARVAIEPLARVAPAHPPDPRAYPPELIELFDQVVEELAAQPRGSLRVRREDGGGGQVWVDAQPIGAVGGEIPLPPGRYRILVTDSLHRPGLRSVLHEVEIRAGEERSLWLDLGWEASADPLDGPSFAWVDERTRPLAASRIAAQLGAGPLVLLWEEAGLLHGAVYDPALGDFGKRAEVHLEGAAEGEALARLAAALLGEPPAPDVLPEPGPPPVVAPLPEVEAPDEARELELRLDDALRERAPPAPAWIRPTKWATAGAAIATAAAGIWLHADAAERQRELDAWSRAVGSVEEGRAALRRSSEIRDQGRLGTGLLVGAGTLGVSSAILFFLDGGSAGD